MRHFAFCRKLLTLTYAGLLLPLPAAASLSWNFTPQVEARVAAEDNVQLSISDEIDTVVTSVGASVEVTGESAVTSVRAVVGVQAADYSDSALSGEDSQFVVLDASRKGRRWEASIRADVRRDTLLRSDDLELPLGAPIEPGFGGVDPAEATGRAEADRGFDETQRHRRTVDLLPKLSLGLSRNTSVELGYRFARQSYDGEDGTSRFVDSTYRGVLASYRWQASRRDQLSISASDFEMDPDEQSKSELRTAKIEWVRNLTAVQRIRLAVGAQRIEVAGVSGSSTRPIVEAVYSRSLKRGSFYALAVRDSYASGFGQIAERDRIGVHLDHGIAKHWRSDTTLALSRTDFPTTTVAGEEQDYLEFKQQISYAATPQLTWSLGYRYRASDRRESSGDASGNMLFAAVSYQPRGKR